MANAVAQESASSNKKDRRIDPYRLIMNSPLDCSATALEDHPV
jgi:hypothetical protein